MHIEPFGVTAMPHTSLLRLAGTRPSLTVDVLRQTNVGDAGGILADQMDMGVEDGGVHRFAVFTQNYDGKMQNALTSFVKVELTHCSVYGFNVPAAFIPYIFINLIFSLIHWIHHFKTLMICKILDCKLDKKKCCY